MKKTVLVVDDEKDLCTILDNSLSLDGYRVISAFDGKRALQLAKKEKPDVILLDIKIPGMDGIEVLRRIKRMKKKIVVVMITAHGSLETAREAMELGAYDYVTKPIDLFLMKSLMKGIVGFLAKSKPEDRR